MPFKSIQFLRRMQIKGVGEQEELVLDFVTDFTLNPSTNMSYWRQQFPRFKEQTWQTLFFYSSH